MATVKVTFDSQLGATWTHAFRQAITRLNTLFNHGTVGVTLSLTGSGPVITVATDASIAVTIVHGKSHTETDLSGRLLKSEVRVPVRIVISTPRAVRPAGPGIYEVVAAHELVHSLGHNSHNTHLMSQTFQTVAGTSAAGDRLQVSSGMLPPIQLSDESMGVLKGRWP